MGSSFNWSEDNLIVSLHAPDVRLVYGLFAGVMYLSFSFESVDGTSCLTPISE